VEFPTDSSMKKIIFVEGDRLKSYISN